MQKTNSVSCFLRSDRDFDAGFVKKRSYVKLTCMSSLKILSKILNTSRRFLLASSGLTSGGF